MRRGTIANDFIFVEWNQRVDEFFSVDDDREDEGDNAPIQFGRGCCANTAWLN